ncbi:DUF3784 domain-containing protein [Acetobacterium sp.]|jgi:hypothetical protein|uniref:DUF3784 domain-containing protein n=1 Tax=Acetobacterium sp. TaxID=1872094 RepID=UPI000CAB5F0A|nr:DUF3784 domain-containing protein [Acetobacterium sp.]MDO9490781.1 DUF3784 domain-containing protein [Acetobacterium sp.]PKM71377.1 MAG: hypothetical protein CVU92_08765 [Firmicutes bacterium HGW-Firmicutes-17]
MDTNDIWAIACLVLAIIFILLALIFALLKEKATILISGFNTLPKELRKTYDTRQMSKDMRNQFALWTIVLLSGAILSHFISFYFAIAASVLWLFLFLKEVHFDIDKAFDRYRK